MLSEIEVQRQVLFRDLNKWSIGERSGPSTNWRKKKDWEERTWSEDYFCRRVVLAITGSPVDGVLSIGDFYHCRSVRERRIRAKGRSRGLWVPLTPSKSSSMVDKEIAWMHKPEWKNGQLYAAVFSAVNGSKLSPQGNYRRMPLEIFNSV